MSFSKASAEQKALFYVPFVVAPISLFSSTYVSYLILRKSNRQSLFRRPRDQLLLGMSFLDILASFGLSFSTTPGPAILTEMETTKVQLPTYGTVQTCAAQGFFVHMGVGVPMYNAAICIYYLLNIRYRFSDRVLMRWLVPTAHCFNFSFTVGTAIAGIILKIFNYAGYLGCYMGTGHKTCHFDPQYCDRGEGAKEFELHFAIIPVATCFCIVVISMVVIYLTVRQMEKRNQRWDFRLSVANNSRNNRRGSLTNMIRRGSLVGTRPSTMGTVEATSGGGVVVVGSSSGGVAGSGSGGGGVGGSGSGTTTPTDNNNNSNNSHRTKMPLTRRTMESGLLYSGAFLLVYFPLILTSQLNSKNMNENLYTTIRIFAVIFFPLQGFFNMLIFTSHVWIKWLKERGRCCGRRRERGPSTKIEEEEEDIGNVERGREEVDYEESVDFFAIKRIVNPDSEEFQHVRPNEGTRSTSFFRLNSRQSSAESVPRRSFIQHPFQRSGTSAPLTPGSPRRASWSHEKPSSPVDTAIKAVLDLEKDSTDTEHGRREEQKDEITRKYDSPGGERPTIEGSGSSSQRSSNDESPTARSETGSVNAYIVRTGIAALEEELSNRDAMSLESSSECEIVEEEEL